MIIKAVFILFIVIYKTTDALRCRQCSGASSLLGCIQLVECSDGEECYMDKYTTNTQSTLYYGGCRASTACQAGTVPHMPTGVKSVNCSKCCDDNSTIVECNVNLCGLQATVGQAMQCYHCDSSSGGGSMGDVSGLTTCKGVTTCQSDEICAVEDSMLSGQLIHRYSCRNARLCALLTKRALEQMKLCKDPVAIASGMCGIGKRALQTLCTGCCGDSMCNYGTCFELRNRLYDMWVNGTLDMNSLTTNSVATIVG